ncbi:MAG: hypothetical protein Q7T61_05850 [Caulobacter sp.]|nr:hypothetical protein [Caulobacter sp.]
MRTADQCLDKAREMEFQALLCGEPEGGDFLEIARSWRRMACLAQLQDLYDGPREGRA